MSDSKVTTASLTATPPATTPSKAKTDADSIKELISKLQAKNPGGTSKSLNAATNYLAAALVQVEKYQLANS